MIFSGGMITSCSQKKNTAADKAVETSPNEKEQTMNDVRSIIIQDDFTPGESDAFSILSAEVNGDILSLLVSYGGGCRDHEWEMYTNNRYGKSYPPKLNIFLKHNANGDMCKALLRDTLKFDLTDVSYKGSDQLHIQMNNFKEFIVYKY